MQIPGREQAVLAAPATGSLPGCATGFSAEDAAAYACALVNMPAALHAAAVTAAVHKLLMSHAALGVNTDHAAT